MDPFNILYTQDSIDPSFQSDKSIPFQWRGRPITEAIDEAKKLGRLPRGLQLNAVRGGDGCWITLNNRTLYVAQQAKLANVSPVDAGTKGSNQMTKLLRNARLAGPVETITVRKKKK
ncbi:MAG: hypothetical protein L3J84_00935 [Gammaproteobacteria bacterium]|nr:hypothetical protein [Gammaproteobacteria bacterium]